MNKALVVFAAWLALGLHAALAPALAIGSLAGPAAQPSFVLPLVIFVCMFAAPTAGLWFAFALGLAVDLISPIPLVEPGFTITLPGPTALGYLAAAYLTLTLRGVLAVRNPLTLIVVTAAGATLAAIVATALLTIRTILTPDILPASPIQLLITGLGSAIYTTVLAAAMTFILLPAANWFGFSDHSRQRFGRRSA